MSKSHHPHIIKSLSSTERHQFAEILRERIYSTITLLAVMVTLWQHADDHSPLATVGIIVGTVVALWLATLIAARMSYRIVHDDHEIAAKSWEAAESARGLLMPAGAPLLFVLLSLTHLISLETALLLGIISLVLSLFLFSIYSGRKLSGGWLQLLFYSSLQMALGIGIVALKILVE